MTEHSTDSSPRGTASDPLIRAFDGLDAAILSYARWPSQERRRAIIVALNTVLELHLFAVTRAVSGELAQLETQQGRLTKQLADLEARISRVEGARSREVGSGGG